MRCLVGDLLAPRCSDHSQKNLFEESHREASGILTLDVAELPRAVVHFFCGNHGEINQACGQLPTQVPGDSRMQFDLLVDYRAPKTLRTTTVQRASDVQEDSGATPVPWD